MADYIRYNYPVMEQTCKQLEARAQEMRDAETQLQTDMAAAIADWTGPSREAFETFMAGYVKKYLSTDVPAVIEQLAAVLRSNMQNMGDTDDAVAGGMPK